MRSPHAVILLPDISQRFHPTAARALNQIKTRLKQPFFIQLKQYISFTIKKMQYNITTALLAARLLPWQLIASPLVQE